MTQIDLMKILEDSLYKMAFQDIERASSGESKIGAFILASCFIDVLARYRYGVHHKEGKNILRKSNINGEPTSNKTLYVGFVKEYFSNKYNAEDLYKSLRCCLVHAYTEGGKYLFTHKNKRGNHFDQIGDKTLLNLEDFIRDIKVAYEKLIKDIKKDEELFENAKFKLHTEGTLMVLAQGNLTS